MNLPLVETADYVVTGYAIPPWVVGILTFALGLAVLIRERASWPSVAFCLMAASGSLWLFSYVGIYSAREDATALGWAKAQNVAVAFIPSLVYLFALTVAQRARRCLPRIGIGLFFSILFATTIVGTSWFVAGVHHYPWGAYARYGWLSVPFLIGFVALIGVSLRIFWQELGQSRSVRARRRFSVLLCGFAIASLGSVDYLPAYGIPVYPIGYLPVFIFLILAAWTLWRYRLVDLTPAFAAPQIISTMADAVLVVDGEGIIRVVNEAACRLFERPESSLVGRPMATIDRRFFGARGGSTVIQTGAIERYETTYPTRQRGGVLLDVAISAIPDRATGQPLGMVCIARDVTERHRAEQRARESARYAEGIVDTMRECLVVLDRNLRVQSANRAFYKMFQLTPEQVRNRTIYELGVGHWGNLSKLRGMLAILPKDQPFQDVEIDYEFPTTGQRTLLLNARRLILQDNHAELILLVMGGVTGSRRSAA